MSLDSIQISINSNWYDVFKSSFFILPANDELKQSIKSKTVGDNINMNDLIDCIVSHSLLSWTNVQNVNGEFVPYTKEEAISLLRTNGSLLQFVLSKTFKV